MSVNITYRGSINAAKIAPTAVVNKNLPLSNAEIDGNFKSIQDALASLSMDANAINFTPTTTLVETNVQGAIQEVDDKFLDKQDTLFSGTNIKTVGGESVLGAGNIDLVTIDGTSLIGTTDIKFKTVEGQSIVGTGDLTVSSLQINDSTTTSTGETWSAKKINDEMIAMGSGVKNDLLGGAGPSFDTLKKIADALASGTGLEVALTAQIAGKQDTLVDSGTGANFKTVEGQSLLGAGNIDFVTVGGQSLLGTGDVEFKTINSTVIVGTGNIAVPSINDTSTGATETWSASKIITELAGKNGDVTQTGTQTLTNKTITGLKETFVSMLTNTIDLSAGNVFAKTISGATSLSVSNAATTGSVSTFILELTNPGTNVSWWSNIRWAGGTAPTLTASGTDILGFYTRDGGSNWRGLVLAKDSK